jgi:predicted transcriptional regulator
MAKATSTDVLTIRIPRETARRLAREAKRQRRSRSQVARDILTSGLNAPDQDPLSEARRQSMLVSERASEQEAIHFIVDAADLRGWQ